MKISGMDNMLIHLSKCCNPVPGDKVMGFITRGRGVSIHTADCPNVADLAFDRDRLVEVSWEILRPRPMRSRSRSGPKTNRASPPVFRPPSAPPSQYYPCRGVDRRGQTGHAQLYHRHQGRGPPEQDHQEHRGHQRRAECAAGEDGMRKAVGGIQ